MTYFERTLLNFLNRSKIKMDITGFDLNGFSKAIHHEWRSRLETIEYIVFEDSDIMSDTEKIASLRELFENEFCDKE